MGKRKVKINLFQKGFKVVNLVLHLICGWVLFITVALLLRIMADSNLTQLNSTEQFYTAAVTSALWILHPLHVSTVLYSVQRMAILATLFSLLGIYFYLAMRRRQIRGQSSIIQLLLLIS